MAKIDRLDQALASESRNRHIAANARRRQANSKRSETVTKKPGRKRARQKPPRRDAAGGTDEPPQAALMPRTRRRLARGTLPIEARLDLHGLSLAEAERALAAFVAQARGQGHVWLLVITGKGVRGEGKLRRALPEWLERGALAGQIVEYGPSAPNHGGDGAFYLRARRARR